MKKINLNILFFLAFLSLFGVLNLLQTNRPTQSILENRALKTMPVFSFDSLRRGQYMKDLEAYYSDTFIMRDTWAAIARDMDSLKGFTDDTGAVLITYNNNVAEAIMPSPDESLQMPEEPPEPEEAYPSTPDSVMATILASGGRVDSNGMLSGIPTQAPSPMNPAPQATEAPKLSPKPEDQKPVNSEPKKVGGLLIANGRAMETHYFADVYCKNYAITLNSFQEKLNDEVKVYSLVAPVAIEFYNVDKFKDITSPQTRTIATINGYFNGNITPIDAYTPISQNTDKYLYFRSDHHWTALGAYYAYTGFMQTIGQEPVPIEQYETDTVEGFLGSLYQSTLSRVLSSNPDIITIYKPYIPHEYTIYYEGPIKMKLIDMNRVKDQNKYRVFMSGDRPWSKITTDVKNGKKIVIIKDSYGNAFIPFLLPHYEEIYTVDPRQFNLNILSFIEEKGIKEVLFLNYINATGQQNYLDLITQMTNR